MDHTRSNAPRGNADQAEEEHAPQSADTRFSYLYESERELEDHVAAHIDHLDGLIVRRQPRTPLNGQPDLLSVNSLPVLNCVEVKLDSTEKDTMGQVLDYMHWIARLTMDDAVEQAACGRIPVDLPVAFAEHFGRPLPAELAGPPTLTLIASTFDRRTFNGLQYLQERGIDVRPLRYVENGRSIEVMPFTAADLDRGRWRRTPSSVSTANHPALRSVVAPYRFHEDVRDFWEKHSCLFVWSFLPFSFIYALYEEWRRTETLTGRPRSAHQYGQFARQVKQLAIRSGEWTHQERYCARSILNAHEPLTEPLSTWERPAPNHPIAGFLRTPPRAQ
jgi:hypothetical protein